MPRTIIDVDLRRLPAVPFRSMAIRFQCGSCAQPIEVDDEWASKTVACPYCRNTVTAPATTTLSDPSELHVASPLTTSVDSDHAQPQRRAPAPPSRNRIAIVAFALACSLVLLLFLADVAILSPHRLEFADWQEALLEAQEEGTPPWAVMQEYIDARGGVMPGWMMNLFSLGVAMMGVWLAALVCGIIGVLRPKRRRFAVIALAICGGFVLQACMGILFG